MKVLATVLFSLVASASFAQGMQVVNVKNSASKVNVKGAYLSPTEGRRLSYDLMVNVEYGNPCMVPEKSELMVINNLKEGRVQEMTLARKNTGKICTMIYSPVYHTIQISNIVDPADGVPEVTINGMEIGIFRPFVHHKIVKLDWTAFAHQVRLDAAWANLLPSNGFDGGRNILFVDGAGTFSNSCHVPDAKDLYRLVEWKNDSTEMEVTLVEKQEKLMACPAIYRPVDARFHILKTKIRTAVPAVTVNGVDAL